MQPVDFSFIKIQTFEIVEFKINEFFRFCSKKMRVVIQQELQNLFLAMESIGLSGLYLLFILYLMFMQYQEWITRFIKGSNLKTS